MSKLRPPDPVAINLPLYARELAEWEGLPLGFTSSLSVLLRSCNVSIESVDFSCYGTNGREGVIFVTRWLSITVSLKNSFTIDCEGKISVYQTDDVVCLIVRVRELLFERET